MAKVLKNEKRKAAVSKAMPQVEVVNNDVEGENEVVNEKNEIIFDEDEKLKEVTSSLEENDVKIILSDAVNNALNELNKIEDMTNNVNDDVEASITFAEEEIEKLDNIKDELSKSINDKMEALDDNQKEIVNNMNLKKIDFTSFWGGFSNGF